MWKIVVFLAAACGLCTAKPMSLISHGNKMLENCKIGPAPERDLNALNSEFCTFSPIYRCADRTAGVDSVTDLTCTNADPAHIRALLLAYVGQNQDPRERLNLNLLWAIYQTKLENSVIHLNGDVLPPAAAARVQSLFLYLDAPASIVEPSFFDHLPNLAILQLEFLHTVHRDYTTVLGSFAGYFRLPALEFLAINYVAEHLALERSTLEDLPRLTCLKLIANRMQCDCALQSLIHDLQGRSPSPLAGVYVNPAVDPFMQYYCDANYAYCDTTPDLPPGTEVPCTSLECLGMPIMFMDLPQCVDEEEPEYPVTVRVSCDADNLQLQLDVRYGAAYSRYALTGFYGQQASGCQAEAGAHRLDGKVGACGVVSGEENGQRYVECVAVVEIPDVFPVQYLLDHPVVEPANQSAYRIRCQEGAKQQKISLRKPLALAAGRSHVVGKGHENVILRVPTHNFAVGKYTFDVLAEGMDSADWDIRVESCWATYTDNADDPLRYDLIHRGCFFDLSTELEFLFTSTHFGYRYAFTPFRFRGQTSGAAFVHCRVGLCQASAADFGACMGRNLDPFCRLPTDLRKITRQVPGRISVLSGPSNRTAPAAVRRPKRSLPEADVVSAALHAPLQPASLWIV